MICIKKVFFRICFILLCGMCLLSACNGGVSSESGVPAVPTAASVRQTTAPTGRQPEIPAENDDGEKYRDRYCFSSLEGNPCDASGYYVDYAGGEVALEIAFTGGEDETEHGIFLLLNGVHQIFSVQPASGDKTVPAYMQTLTLRSRETVRLRVTFVPNTGRRGDVLDLEFWTVIMPSYTTVFTGYHRYGRFYEHLSQHHHFMRVNMLADAPVQMPPAEVASEVVPLEYADTHGANLSDGDATYVYLLSSYKTEANTVLYVREPDSDALYIDAFGAPETLRLSLFINHEPVDLGNGSTYMDCTVMPGMLTRLKPDVDLSALGQNNHAYVIVAGDKKNNPYAPDGSYYFHDKTDTCFLIVENQGTRDSQ